MSLESINPTTGELIKRYREMDVPEINFIIESAHHDYLQWRNRSIAERAQKMYRVAELLHERKERYATLIAQEMGKPIKKGMMEIEKCAWACDHFAHCAKEWLEPQIIPTQMQKSFVAFEPIGLIFAIMPWNFPFWQVFRFAATNLMAGNGCLLKHARSCTGISLEIEQLFRDAEFPEHIFRSLLIDADQAPFVIAHPKIAGVTLTGSEKAGMSVASEAGKALKKVVLELGGNDPYVILEDADLQLAAETCLESRLNNSGQVCIAAKRIIVVDEVYDSFQSILLEKIKHYTLGDPLKHETVLGPLARSDLRDKVHQQVQESLAKGALLELGGEIPEGPGFYYPVTMLTHVEPGMPAFDDEIFGPVVALIRAQNEQHAIELANHSRFGLGGAVFTEDLERGERIAIEKIHVGFCAVNTSVRSDPRLPFGGIKHSGFGRELGIDGMHEFMNVKTITLA